MKILNAGADRLVVEHHMKLRCQDQDTDASEHAVDHGRRDGAKPLTELEGARGKLQEAGEQYDDAQHLHALLLHELEHKHAEPGGRATHL